MILIQLFSQNNEKIYNNKKYILDSPEDLNTFECNSVQGSIAFIISTGEYYMLNGAKQWIKINIKEGF